MELETRPGELTGTQRRMREDYERAVKWMGVESVDRWRAMSHEERREFHEKWARAFEAYLREGKAPSPELRSMFARARAWLLNIYRSLRQLNVTLDPEITGIFDRLLATDEQISRAEQEAGILAMIEQQGMKERLGVSDEAFRLYRADVQKASDARRDELQREYMDEFNRTSEDWYRQRRVEVRAEVAAEVHGQRDYIALSFLAKGTLPDGSAVPEGIQAVKLDAASLEERYGRYKDSTVVQALRKLDVYRRKEGVPADTVASLFGYSSGDELVQALVNLRPINPLIEALTDDRMKEQYGGMLIDGTASEKARDAVMTAGRSEVIAAEMKALAKRLGKFVGVGAPL